jgi:hypothetical protein
MPPRRRRNATVVRQQRRVVQGQFGINYPLASESVADGEIICDLCQKSWSRNHGGFARHRKACERDQEEKRLIQERRDREQGTSKTIAQYSLFDVVWVLALQDLLRGVRFTEEHHGSVLNNLNIRGRL